VVCAVIGNDARRSTMSIIVHKYVADLDVSSVNPSRSTAGARGHATDVISVCFADRDFA